MPKNKRTTSKNKQSDQSKSGPHHNRDNDHDHHHSQSSMISKNKTLTIKLDWSEIKPIKQKVEAKLAKQVKLDGFRRGKVPTHIAKAYFKPEAVIEAVLEKILAKKFVEATEKLEEKPIATPEYRVKSAEDGKEWVVEANYATQPKIKLGSYKQIVKKAIQTAKKQNTTKKKTDKKQQIAQEQLLSAIYRDLVVTIKPKIPELLVRRETQYEIERLASQLKQHNLTLQDYVERSKMNPEQISNELAAEALGRLQLTFILQAIAKEAKLKVNETEVKKIMKDQTDQRMADYVRETLIRQKLARYLLSLDNK